jgi:hypothetical protein
MSQGAFTMKPDVQETDPRSNAWWRVPEMWLVIGGPLSVVLACLVTAVFVWSAADRVVGDAVDEAASGHAQPAMKARNHAASPR